LIYSDEATGARRLVGARPVEHELDGNLVYNFSIPSRDLFMKDIASAPCPHGGRAGAKGGDSFENP